MKKIIAIMLVAMMAMMIVACDPKPAKPTDTTTEGVVSTAPDTYPVSEIVTDTEIIGTDDTADITPISADITETESSAVTSESVAESDTATSDEVDERGF